MSSYEAELRDTLDREAEPSEVCAYCLRRVAAHFTGRRWLCDYCWEEWIDRGPE